MNQFLDYMQLEQNIVIWQWQADQLHVVVELKSEANTSSIETLTNHNILQ